MYPSRLFLVFFLASSRAISSAGPVDSVTQAEVAAANALLAAHKPVEAQAAFEKILVHAPDNADANCSLALIACDSGDDGAWGKALRCADKAVTSDPNNARYQYVWGAANGLSALKAGLFSKLGHARKCLAAYERAAELEPRTIQYRWALLNWYQQAPGFVGGDRAKAYGQATALKEIDPEQGRQAFTQLYVGEKKYDQAFRLYDEALHESPNNYATLYNFGWLTLQTVQRLDEGEAAFRRCLELTPPEGNDMPSHANVHWRLGNVCEKKKQPEQARAEYRAALNAAPDFWPAQQALEKLNSRKS